MISYAQNREDVVLARALPEPVGFYVDVGAADPVVASVTKHFYDLGWHGINLEPRPTALAKLEFYRPRDRNLGVAVGSENGTTTFCIVEEDPDLSTMVEFDSERLTHRGYSTSLHSVEVRTLNDVLSQYGVQSIDFLKIDVEGAETEVLEGLDLALWRPRVIVIEAVEPYGHVRTDHLWRHILERAGYQEGCFDGINLFFAQADDSFVLNNLVPASPIDDFKTAHVANLERDLGELSAFAKSLESELRRVQDHHVEVVEYVRQLEAALSNNGNVAVKTSESHARPVGSRALARRETPKHLRLAILATPCTGAAWLLRALEAVFEAPGISPDHPADVPWESLPSRIVLETPHSRSRLLQKQLEKQDFVVVSIARQPVDTLLSIADLAGAGSQPALLSFGADGLGVAKIPGPDFDDDEFLNWATSSAAHRLLCITPSWWVLPSTVRVRTEELVQSAGEVLSMIMEVCGREGPTAPTPPQIDGLAMDLNWHRSPLAESLLTGDGLERIYEAHRDIFEILGYVP
jgi:FkbM family methyltransferase